MFASPYWQDKNANSLGWLQKSGAPHELTPICLSKPTSFYACQTYNFSAVTCSLLYLPLCFVYLASSVQNALPLSTWRTVHLLFPQAQPGTSLMKILLVLIHIHSNTHTHTHTHICWHLFPLHYALSFHYSTGSIWFCADCLTNAVGFPNMPDTSIFYYLIDLSFPKIFLNLLFEDKLSFLSFVL